MATSYLYFFLIILIFFNSQSVCILNFREDKQSYNCVLLKGDELLQSSAIRKSKELAKQIKIRIEAEKSFPKKSNYKVKYSSN
ncbi:unnamed protein product [Paramecium octaurelia]|uniref:Uncharacterized protein n=1 Tax=Paramecium octaurelia TaxID=43137 RepID=A0A8S1UA07_PAROT|nr:unnamed protein product [Paramecium octaurelia]